MNNYTITKPINADSLVESDGVYLRFEMWEDLYNYLIFDKKHKDSKHTTHTYRSRFFAICKFLDYKLPFNRKNFNNYIKYLKEQGKAHNTINNFIKIGKHIDKYYNINEIQDYTYFPKEGLKPLEVLTPDEIVKIADVNMPYDRSVALKNQVYSALIWLLATTGCRINEALGLEWSDLFGDPRSVRFRETKNGETRIVPISDIVYNKLIKLANGNKYIFSTQRGLVKGKDYGMTPQTVNSDLQARAEKVGIKKYVYCHLFRHSYITEMIRQGVSIAHIARIVGHKDLGTTNEYTHLVIDDLTDAIYSHPILRKGLTFEMLSKKMKKILDQSTDITKFSKTVKEAPDEITITIKKL